MNVQQIKSKHPLQDSIHMWWPSTSRTLQFNMEKKLEKPPKRKTVCNTTLLMNSSVIQTVNTPTEIRRASASRCRLCVHHAGAGPTHLSPTQTPGLGGHSSWQSSLGGGPRCASSPHHAPHGPELSGCGCCSPSLHRSVSCTGYFLGSHYFPVCPSEPRRLIACILLPP